MYQPEYTQRRVFPRKPYQVDVRITMPHSNQVFNSQTYNVSQGGMCCETLQRLEPASNLYITVGKDAPGFIGLKPHSGFLAKVQWIHEWDNGKTGPFVAGVKFMESRSQDLEACESERLCPCDLCEDWVPADQIRYTEKDAQLCKYCSEHLDHMPRGKIVQCVERFLCGNVI